MTSEMLHVEQTESRVRDIPIADITRNPFQPRSIFDEDEMAALQSSIASHGLLQPLVVREWMPDAYELVAGERRLRAATALGWKTIPALIRPVSDPEMRLLAIVENVQRANLNVMEEARSVTDLMGTYGYTQEEAALLLGNTRAHISHLVGVSRLPESVQRKLAAQVISLGHAKLLMGLPSDQAEAFADRCVREDLTVRGLQEVILLGRPERVRKPRAPHRRPETMEAVTCALEEVLETRVRVEIRAGRGTVSIDFADQGDLQRILDRLGLAQVIPQEQRV